MKVVGGYELYTAGEFATAKFEQKYLIDNVLTKGEPMLIVGPSKALKTPVAADMSVSLAMKLPFLGEFQVDSPVRVLMVSGESGKPTLRETFERVYETKGTTAEKVSETLCISPSRLSRLDDPKALSRLVEAVSDFKAEVLFLDPAYQAMPGERAGSVCDNGQLLAEITAACSDAGAQLVLLHHSKKPIYAPSASMVPDLNDAAGAGYAEWARQWILLNRRSAYQPGKNELHMWIGGSAGHGGNYYLDVDESRPEQEAQRVWQPTVRTADEGKQEAAEKAESQKNAKAAKRLRDDMDAIEEFLKQNGPASKTAIKDATTQDTKRNNAALGALKTCGVVENCAVKLGNGQTKEDGFKLAA